MARDDMNTAYDLSLYDASEERQIARTPKKEKKENKVIKATLMFLSPLTVFRYLTYAVAIALAVAALRTGRQITATTKRITNIQTEITSDQSELDYLNFTLESRMTLDEIESYATGTLGMVKMDPSQTVYVELEDSNAFVVYDSSVKTRITEAVKPLIAFLVP